ncbi:MAG: hypothetical protein HY744_32685, partial [Deltaproteobacteria bacterium]|nr:hypothetical protein [Deltaproteobacteria bacterium]
ALAALGAGPALGEAALGLPRAAAWATGSLPVVLRAGRLVARGVLSGSNPTLLVASWAAALVLIVMGLALARLWSQPTGEVA